MSADTTPTISDTFCPAKWDELQVNFGQNYAYSCCKGTPTQFTENVIEFVERERINLLNGVQDPSCDYCWKVEKSGNKSLRHTYLEKFNAADFDRYTSNPTPRLVELSLGNECNLQCVYCNPKFSSKWEHDVSERPYKVFADRYVYAITPKNTDVMERNIDFLQHVGDISVLNLIGGEPLINKKFFQLLDVVSTKYLSLSSNLMVNKQTLDRFINATAKFERVNLRASLDATKVISEFVRYGLDYDQFVENVQYLQSNAPNVKIQFGSVMTSITVRDLEHFRHVVQDLGVEWNIDVCQTPRIHSMSTLPDWVRPEILNTISQLESFDIRGLDVLKSAVENTPFNKTLYKELVHFVNEFAQRKKIPVPICLD